MFFKIWLQTSDLWDNLISQKICKMVGIHYILKTWRVKFNSSKILVAFHYENAEIPLLTSAIGKYWMRLGYGSQSRRRKK